MSYENCIKPVIEVLTLAGVFGALIYQNQTIAEQRKEFKRQKIKDNIQQFENSFFHLLNEYNQLTDKYTGLGNLKYPKQSFLDLLDIELRLIEIEGTNYTLSDILNLEDYKSIVELPLSIPNEVFPKNDTVNFIDWGLNYFNFMNAFFKIIDSITIYDSLKENIEFRKIYYDLLKSKFSLYENYYILIYSLSSNGSEFKNYIEKYSLFDSIKLHKCFRLLKQQFKASAFAKINHT